MMRFAMPISSSSPPPPFLRRWECSADLSFRCSRPILVNVGRAQLVDTNAMVHALESGQLGGAVLDVFDTEPLDAASPLWSMPNVIITPHSAGFRVDHWQEVTDLFIENVGRFRRGESLLNVVDPVAGY
jgi:phosphoglycerate dehydrogenase-like enzyme